MAPLLFTNSALLAGLAALGIPILIHLLMRQKRIRQRFSSIQFFLKLDRKSGHRQKLRQWLLLATRLLLLALIIVAFARPYQEFNGAANGSQPRRNIVFILDRTASMLAEDNGLSRWAQGKLTINNVLDTLTWNDQVALVECATPSSIVFPLMPPSKLKTELEKLEPGYGTGSLGDALQEASKLLLAHKLNGKPSIYVVSDLQRQGCSKIASAPIARQIELKVFPLGETQITNRAILNLAENSQGARSLTAEVVDFNLSQTPVKINWVIDGQEKGRKPQKPSLAKAETNATLVLPELIPGWHQIEARLDSEDSLPADNSRWVSLHVPTPTKVLSIEPRTTPHRFEEESFFVNSALDPTYGSSNAPLASFRVEKVGMPEAGSVLANWDRLFQYQLVLLPALRDFPGSEAILTDFVKKGGAIVFWTGNNLNPGRFNAQFEKILPATLRQSEGSLLEFNGGWHLGEIDLNSAIFSIFRQQGSGDVHLPQFTKRYILEPEKDSQVLARFADSAPFLMVRNIGQGRVALVNTSVDASWSDWPKRKTFVPWIHSLCHYLTRTEGGAGLNLEKSVVANSIVEVQVDGATEKSPFTMRAPDGVESRVQPNDLGLISFRAKLPGLYTITDPKGQVAKVVPVNVTKSESELSCLSQAEFEQQIVRCDAPVQGGLAGELLYSGSGTRDFWRILMIAAVVLLVLETLLANRTYA